MMNTVMPAMVRNSLAIPQFKGSEEDMSSSANPIQQAYGSPVGVWEVKSWDGGGGKDRVGLFKGHVADIAAFLNKQGNAWPPLSFSPYTPEKITTVDANTTMPEEIKPVDVYLSPVSGLEKWDRTMQTKIWLESARPQQVRDVQVNETNFWGATKLDITV